MPLLRKDFNPGFIWGVASSAYQAEGAWDADGKGKSIWDVFANTRGKIYKNHNANQSCEFYNRFRTDIDLLKQLGIPNFRFSISWSRILPDGIKPVNDEGANFYNNVIDYCLESGIEPWITLYHWDLPWELEKRGGWTNRDILGWFGDYVELCVKLFGHKVRHWIVMNEPLAFTGAGYFFGLHAPGRHGLKNFLPALHHAALCQAEGARIIRSLLPHAKVGTSFSCSLVEPYRNTQADIQATFRADALMNRLFADPLAGLGYPVDDLKFLFRMEPFIMSNDESKLAFEMDFIGVQNYTRDIVTHSFFMPYIWARIINAKNRSVEVTEMNWEVHPESLYRMLQKFSCYKNFKELIVSESGAAFNDVPEHGKIADDRRRSYHEQCLRQIIRAKNEGINVTGYFAWSFTDNFEWAEGFRPRFGLVYVDFKTQERIVKDSGLWFSRLLQE